MRFESLLPIIALAPGLAFAAEYQIDPAHSAAQFSVRHMMVSNVRGAFSKVTGTIVYDADDLNATRVDAAIDATTLDTREPKRDAHLKSPDFFDVAKYPTLSFHGKQVSRSSGKLQVKGDLTMHGVTREVVLTVDGPTPEIKDARGKARIGASATTTINRKDWGLNWNAALEAGGVVVGDEVTLTLDIEALRVQPAAASPGSVGR